jgi:UDPglucose 6-dehydrogenase
VSHPVIGFAGMTHLGLVSGVAAAEKGFAVVCFDPDRDRVSSISVGSLPVSEPQLTELALKNAERIEFTSSAADLERCDVILVAADVPTDDVGKSDLGSINALLDIVFSAARDDAVIVVLSQVPPGFTRERQVGNRALYYQAETLIFGRAVERALFPEQYVIGAADPAAPLPAPYAQFLAIHECPILTMRYESAELAKIAINMCLVASLSAANTLAELCEKIGADWSEIVPALRLDRRIGPHAYLIPGLGIAGGNLERDLASVCDLANRYGTDAGVVRAWIANSRHRKDWAVETIKSALLDDHPDATIAVWGLAYKENTHSIKGSPSILTISKLLGTRLRFHDPVVSGSVTDHAKAVRSSDPLEALASADALMILTPWPLYREIAPADIVKAMTGRIVLDPYGVLDAERAAAAGLDMFTLGRAPLRGEPA